MTSPVHTLRAVLASALLVLLSVSASAQVPVDARFVVEEVASGSGTVCLEIDATGALYVCEKRGRLLRYAPNGSGGFGAPAVVVDLRAEVDARVEGGLLGLALAPDFAASGQVYVLFTTSTDQRIERLTLNAARTALAANGRSIVLAGLPRATAEHKAGHIAFRPGDATHLYVALGDDADPARAQDLAFYNGKILRIRAATGEGETDNPHYDGSVGSVRSRIFARGMRNPFRFVFHPTEHALYVSENGDDTDRLSRVRPGSNGSWSTAGDSADFLNPPDPGFRVMRTFPARTSLVGLALVRGGAFGDPTDANAYVIYQGNAFNDAAHGLRRFRLSGAALDVLTPMDAGAFLVPSAFAFGAEMELSPDGALYCTQAGVDEADGPGFTLARIRFAGGEPPVASFTITPDPAPFVLAPFSVTVRDTSTDEDGMVVSRTFDFGDGTTSTALEPSHVYTHAGTFTLSLRVVDDTGLVGTTSREVRVRAETTLRLRLGVRDGDVLEGEPLGAGVTLALFDADGVTEVPIPGGPIAVPASGELDVTRTLVVPGDELVAVLSGAGYAERRFAITLDSSLASQMFAGTFHLGERAIAGRVRSTRGDPALVDLRVRHEDAPYAFAGARDGSRTDSDALGFFYVPLSRGDAGTFELSFVDEVGADTFWPRTVETAAPVMLDVVLGLRSGGRVCREITGPRTRRVDFTADVLPILERCIGCHGASATGNGGLDLVTDPFLALVGRESTQVPGMLLIDPRDASSSYLMEKLACASPQVGMRMPIAGELTDAELAVLRDFIEQGARRAPASGGCAAGEGTFGPAGLLALVLFLARRRRR